MPNIFKEFEKQGIEVLPLLLCSECDNVMFEYQYIGMGLYKCEVCGSVCDGYES